MQSNVEGMNGLISRLREEAGARVDVVADTRHLRMRPHGDHGRQAIEIYGNPDPAWPISEHAHGLIADRLDIPRKYYRRLEVDYPDLLRTNVNELWESEPQRVLVRSVAGQARAVLSDSYLPVDNLDVIDSLLPVFTELARDAGRGLEVPSVTLSEHHMHIALNSPRMLADIREGDPVSAGVVISNSENGSGSLRAAQMLYRLVCLNGMIAGTVVKRHHVGAKASHTNAPVSILRPDTLRATREAILLQMRDAVRDVFAPEGFEALVSRMRAAAEDAVWVEPARAVARVAQDYVLTEAERDVALAEFLRASDPTRYGLINAVTFAAHATPQITGDRQAELSALAGKILDLEPGQWRTIAGDRPVTFAMPALPAPSLS